MSSDKPADAVASASDYDETPQKISSEKFSPDNSSSESDTENYHGIAFGICFIGVYCFTSADLVTSGIVAFIAAVVVYFMR